MSNFQQQISNSLDFERIGIITSVAGNRITVIGIAASVGCRAMTGNNTLIECVGFKGNESYFVSLDKKSRILYNDEVVIIGDGGVTHIPSDFLGRVIDSYGNDLNNKNYNSTVPINTSGIKINPLDRPSIKLPLDVGVSSINTFSSIGLGQRVGIMAGSGVGKSTLLGMITKFTNADSVVVSLVGERGREVQDFINNSLDDISRNKCVIIATPADRSSIEKVHGAELACGIAEKLRDQGDNVLLLMDSITRYANAYRDILIDGGEMPVSRGYPPSTFSKIYDLIERSGTSSKGSITGIFTVLVDGDNLMDPIADHCRGILDGHIILNRKLAEQGIYPPIDISSSISRVMDNITVPDHQKMVVFLKSIYNAYYDNKDLISMGYEPGSDKDIDRAIKHIDTINSIIIQDKNEGYSLSECLNKLREVYQIVSS